MVIAALSTHSVKSKLCQTQLQYALALAKPIMPIQFGPLETTLVNPLSTMQILDYQNPSIETGIALIAAVQAARARSVPLPDPLPEEPPMPFAYLMSLASHVSAPQLNAQEQNAVAAELLSAFELDGEDDSARRDITQLLLMLRARADVTYKTRTVVDSVLSRMVGPS